MARDIYKYTNPVTNESFTYSASKDNRYDAALAQAINYIITTGDTDNINIRKYLKEVYKNPNQLATYELDRISKDALYFVEGVYKVNTDDIKTYASENATKDLSIISPVGTTNNSDISNKTNTIDTDVNANSNNILTFDFRNPYTDEVKKVTIGDTTAYEYTKGGKWSRNSDVYYTIEYMLHNGDVDPNDKEQLKALEEYIEAKKGANVNDADRKEAIKDAHTFFHSNDIDLADLGTFESYSEPGATIKGAVDKATKTSEVDTQETTDDYKKAAEDYYFTQAFDLEGDTLANDMYTRLTEIEQNAAISNMQLAEAQYQQAAMQQAEVVKSITDQVKAERMARLKAGMNEAQIANQDMQIMLNNMNTLNQQMGVMNQNKLAAQQQFNTAQDTAYQQYLNNAMNIAQTGAALSAANAGDATRQALLDRYYSNLLGNSYTKSRDKITTGGNQ